MLRKISNTDSYKVRWEKVNSLIDALSRQELKPGIGVKLQKTAAGTVIEQVPQHQDAKYKSYDGPFCCKLSINEKEIEIIDPADYSGETAGFAYINGVYKEIVSGKLPLQEDCFREEKYTAPDGSEKSCNSSYVCLCLAPSGKVSFKMIAEPVNRIYDGEFAVEYNRKEQMLVVVDGSNAKSGTAGSLFCNGVYKSMPSGRLEATEGTLCIALDSAGHLTYKIIKTPDNRIYDGEFAVEYNQETGLVDVFDGMFAPGGNAGHAFVDGEWKNIPAASLVPANGYLCLRYSTDGTVGYVITNTPKTWSFKK